MMGRRYPYRLRADGRLKGLYLERCWPWVVGLDHVAPQMNSAHRTRSKRALAGSRGMKRRRGGAR